MGAQLSSLHRSDVGCGAWLAQETSPRMDQYSGVDESDNMGPPISLKQAGSDPK